MTSSVLTNLQLFCRSKGIIAPNTIQTNSDAHAMQLLALMNYLPLDLATRKCWQAVTLEASFVTVADDDQGPIDTIALGYRGIKGDTMYDRATTLPVAGGISAQEWQFAKASRITGPFYRFRLRNNHLLFNPAPPAGKTIYFEYFSERFVRTIGGDPSPFFAADTDKLCLNDSIALTWIAWRWKMEKGLDYAEDFRQYEMAVASLSHTEDRPLPADAAARAPAGSVSGIVVPLGSWQL